MFPILAGSSSTGYNLTRSLRFRNSASAYLNRTPASAGNRQKFTFSFWIKRGLLTYNYARLYSGGNYGTAFVQYTIFAINNNDVFSIESGQYGGASDWSLLYPAVFRDPSAWYHVVVAFDTTQATDTNRVKIYVNNVLQVASSGSYPAINYNTEINNNVVQTIAKAGGETFDGCMAEFNFINGQQLTPSSFGSTNVLTGVWQPAQYSGSYGTNGYYLNFTDNSALTTASNVGLGKDFSGNANYWVTNNISITAGYTYDSSTDVPTLTSATTSNFAVLNPLVVVGNTTFQNANLYMTGNSSGTHSVAPSTVAVSSGKFYAEFRLMVAGDNFPQVGIVSSTANLVLFWAGKQRDIHTLVGH
jgi:hypothetical protein